MIDQISSTSRSIRRHLLAGVAVFLLMTLGVGGWAATTEISGAIIALGTLVVETNVKKVQHASGGIVGELRVVEGDRVGAGDILVRLDDTVTRANLAIITKGLDELLARKVRLEAERDGADALKIPDEFLGREGEPNVAQVLEGERKLFAIRRSARLGQKAQLSHRIDQLREQSRGFALQLAAKEEEITLIKRELDGAQKLWARNLMPITKYTALQREATKVEGERGQLVAAVAQTNDKIAETELQIIQIDKELASEVGKDLREVEGKIGELVERRISADDQLKRIDIRSPQNGRVHQLTVHTVGGVIVAGGEPIMLIVPDADSLAIDARVLPQDIDQLSVGRSVFIRFSALNHESTPEIKGTLTRISADTSVDNRTGHSYYSVRIGLNPDDVARLGSAKLVPGMPVEVFIQAADRTVLSYLVKPLQDQITRALREN